ncbi:hypothetical protein [Lentzea californiensis]|uniref:hypothetical protein n=1 Tax=Lentzea californiensis TaxID=438851 RepID=UPI002166551C|nr:hypothetical protein [Lentzea californiensis]MCR3750274.1 hypothetical protein [Lentzea californiensis]
MSDHLPADIRVRLAELAEALESLDLEDVAPEHLCWATLIPQWTEKLTIELGLVDSPSDFRELVERLDDADLIECRRSLGRTSEIVYWVRARQRKDVGEHLQREFSGDLDGQVRQVFALVRAARPSNAVLRRWLDVEDFWQDPSGAELMATVESRLRKPDIPAAAALIAVAQHVSDVVGGPLEQAVQRAQWRLGREYRVRDDVAHLAHYFRRRKAEDAIRELCEPAAKRWMLHLLGDAGVGKTMTIRYLASGKFAADQRMEPMSVARVDFDHLDPLFPELRPAELVLRLSDELLGYAGTRAVESSYRRLHDAANELHTEIAKPESAAAQVRSLRHKVVERFGSLVDELPQPVVLVLDTCEELAKLYAPGVDAPAIDHTFELLEMVHRRSPHVRVVLAGRRWLTLPPEEQRPHGGPNLRDRPHVNVLHMPGFTADEAAGYLAHRSNAVKRLIPEDLWSLLLRRAIGADGIHHNPFELAVYCDWVLESETFSAADLVDSVADPYVERRIIARINDRDVREALPVAVELGRFDLDLITPSLKRAGVDPLAAFQGLAAHEWVNILASRPDGRPAVIEVDDHVRDRMRAVVAKSPVRYPIDRIQLGRDAVHAMDSKPLREIPAETVEAAVRLLPADRAAEVWVAVDARICAESEWAWAMQITPRVAAVEAQRDTGEGPTILAAVLATQASARIHTGQRATVSRLWESVIAFARRHPDPALRTVLEDRAVLGVLATRTKAGLADGQDVLAEQPGRAFTRWERSWFSSPDVLIGALESQFDGAAAGPSLEPALVALTDSERNAVGVTAAILHAAHLLRTNDLGGAAVVADLAVARAERADTSQGQWRDWLPPRGLVDRARLMRVLIALNGGEAVPRDVLDEWKAESLRRSTDIDADRLAAAIVDYDLCFGRLHEIPEHEALLEPGQSSLRWLHHRMARPLAGALADAWSLAENPGKASDVLRGQRDAALLRGDDPDIVEACDLAALRLCRWHRTTQWAPVNRLVQDGTPRTRAEASLVLALLGEREIDPSALDRPDADLVDEWESACLLGTSAPTAAERLLRLGPVGATALRGRIALMAGESLLLVSADNAAPLLRRARELLEASGFDEASERAAALESRLVVAEPPVEERTPTHVERPPMSLAQAIHDTTPSRLFFLLVLSLLPAVLFYFSTVIFFISVILAVLGPVVVLMALALRARDRALGGASASRIVIEPVANGKVRLSLASGDTAELDHAPGRPAGDDQDSWATEIHPADPFETVSLAMASISTRSAVDGRLTAVALHVHPSLEPLGWEQWLGYRPQSTQLTNLLWLRLQPGRRPVIREADWARGDVVHGGPERLFARSVPGALEPPALEPPLREPPVHKLVHLIGSTVVTSSGVSLRVRDFDAKRRASSETLVDLDAMMMTPTSLVVLQADPADTATPLGDVRDEFIRLATAAVSNGAQYVIVVPPLPDAVVRRVSSEVSKAIRGSAPPTARRALVLFGRIKRLVVKEEQPLPLGQWANLDVMLFMRGAR